VSCVKCYQGGGRRTAYRHGFIVAATDACDECWGDFTRGLEDARRQFGALLDKGLSREAANEEMSRRIKSGELP
jgi:hypothetical protein